MKNYLRIGSQKGPLSLELCMSIQTDLSCVKGIFVGVLMMCVTSKAVDPI